MAASRRDDRRRGSGRLRYYRHADYVSKPLNFARVQMHEKCVQGRRARLHTFFGTHSKSRNAARAEPSGHTHVSASSIYSNLFESIDEPFYLLGLNCNLNRASTLYSIVYISTRSFPSEVVIRGRAY